MAPILPEAHDMPKVARMKPQIARSRGRSAGANTARDRPCMLQIPRRCQTHIGRSSPARPIIPVPAQTGGALGRPSPACHSAVLRRWASLRSVVAGWASAAEQSLWPPEPEPARGWQPGPGWAAGCAAVWPSPPIAYALPFSITVTRSPSARYRPISGYCPRSWK